MRLVRGESQITKAGARRAGLFAARSRAGYPESHPRVVTRDMIVLGAAYTHSILPNLLVADICQGFASFDSHQSLICNVATQPAKRMTIP
jgi:2-phospho-L-lactate transferase/gluconeogenesis factor (CofD/UPF0052 family)